MADDVITGAYLSGLRVCGEICKRINGNIKVDPIDIRKFSEISAPAGTMAASMKRKKSPQKKKKGGKARIPRKTEWHEGENPKFRWNFVEFSPEFYKRFWAMKMIGIFRGISTIYNDVDWPWPFQRDEIVHVTGRNTRNSAGLRNVDNEPQKIQGNFEEPPEISEKIPEEFVDIFLPIKIQEKIEPSHTVNFHRTFIEFSHFFLCLIKAKNSNAYCEFLKNDWNPFSSYMVRIFAEISQQILPKYQPSPKKTGGKRELSNPSTDIANKNPKIELDLKMPMLQYNTTVVPPSFGFGGKNS